MRNPAHGVKLYPMKQRERFLDRAPAPGKIDCPSPLRGRWGGPWPDWKGGGGQQPRPAQGLAFADRSGTLAMYVAQDVPELKFVADTPPPALADPKDTKSDPKTDPKDARKPSGCACTTRDPSDAGFAAVALLALGLLRRRR